MSQKKIQPIRGTHDLMPSAYRAHDHVIQTARLITQTFGFQPMETPIIEPLETFQKPLGESSDIIGKEMYVFEDRGGSSIVLRPEGTAATVRAMLHHHMEQDVPLRFFYHGPMFRYDRPQKGRQRQFHQVSVELLGDGSCLADAEVILASWQFLKALGLQDKVRLEINSIGDGDSRAGYREALVSYFQSHRSELSEDSQRRLETNPLRILDSKSEQDHNILQGAPLLQDALTPEAQERFQVLKGLLESHQVPYQVSPYLVRGLDYYGHTVFEWTTETLGAQATVLAGGCYPGLVQMMGGPALAGVGWSAGVERLALMLDGDRVAPEKPTLYILPLTAAEWGAGLDLAAQLREAGLTVEVWGAGSSLGKQFKVIDRRGGRWVAVLGEDEVRSGQVSLRDLQNSHQSTLAQTDLLSSLIHHMTDTRKVP